MSPLISRLKWDDLVVAVVGRPHNSCSASGFVGTMCLSLQSRGRSRARCLAEDPSSLVEAVSIAKQNVSEPLTIATAGKSGSWFPAMVFRELAFDIFRKAHRTSRHFLLFCTLFSFFLV